MPSTVVQLSRKYTVHDQVFDTITLREPTFREIYMDGLGKPQEWQPTPHGSMVVTYSNVINDYLQKIVEAPGYECIGALSAVDALKLGAAVCDFFLDPKSPVK